MSKSYIALRVIVWIEGADCESCMYLYPGKKKFQIRGPKGLSKYIYFSRQLGNGTTFRKSIKYSILYFNCFPIFISLCYNYILLVNRDNRLKY